MRWLFLLILSMLSYDVYAQFVERALMEERGKFYDRCYNSIKNANITNLESISEALWIIGAFNQQGKDVDLLLNELFSNYDLLGQEQKYAFISVLASYPYPQKSEILKQAIVDSDMKLRLLAYSILLDCGESRDYVVSVDEKWTDIKKHIQEKSYLKELSDHELRVCVEHLALIAPDRFHLVALVRSDRNVPVKLFILRPNEKTLVGKDSYRYLARSAYNTLPYFTNGNTPCGIFKIKMKSESDNTFIGPIKTLITELPFESNVVDWDNNAKKWLPEVYFRMLPQSLRTNPMLWQAYLAGRVGRGEIIIHGSTIDPLFFQNCSYFPLTPSLGCLSALELWDMNSGRLLESHQKRLINDIPDNPDKMGFLYVLQVEKSCYDNY